MDKKVAEVPKWIKPHKHFYASFRQSLFGEGSLISFWFSVSWAVCLSLSLHIHTLQVWGRGVGTWSWFWNALERARVLLRLPDYFLALSRVLLQRQMLGVTIRREWTTQEKSLDVGVRQTWARILGLRLPSYGPLDKLMNLPKWDNIGRVHGKSIHFAFLPILIFHFIYQSTINEWWKIRLLGQHVKLCRTINRV